ncbi:MAG TPA: hypothetical protein VI457_16595 [Methylococcaceae bacterium]|nr:hypothetical protein [Methylococcaceae bacterium]
MQDRADSSHEGGSGLLPRQTHLQETWLIPAASQRIPDSLLLVLGFALCFVLLLLVMPAKRILDRYEERLTAPSTSTSKLDGYSAETEKLQKKVLDLVTASIETRLQGIESDILANQVTPAKLQALEELKQELRILAAYTKENAGDPGTMVVRGGIPLSNARSLPDEQKREMREEIAQLKNLFYFSLVSCGAMVLLAGGYWLQTRQPRLLRWSGSRAYIDGDKTRR